MYSSDKITSFSEIAPILCGNKKLHFDKPLVMGILNVTPDSFYDGGLYQKEENWLEKAHAMVEEGVDIIDIGAMSSRPGAELISEETELERLIPVVSKLVACLPDAIFSVDTFRGRVVEEAQKAGVHIVNDISAGSLDAKMLKLSAQAGLPYVLMHMQGNPANMQLNPQYNNVVEEVMSFFKIKIQELQAAGIQSIILDPGFGFGKTVKDNYTILRNLSYFKSLGLPLMVGLSRKSMIYKPLNSSPSDVLHATSALHFQAVINGANILRVHDVWQAKSIITLVEHYTSYGN